MRSLERRLPTAVNTISVLLLVAYVIAECRDVSALTSADQFRTAAKSTSHHLNKRVQHLRSSLPNEDNDISSNARSTVRRKRDVDNVDETPTIGGNAAGLLPDDDRQVNDDKRKWEKNTVRVWGKRNSDDTLYPYGNDDAKRTWSKNRVRVWGKRYDADDNEGFLERWNTQNRAENDDSSAGVTAKRRWSDNRVRVWGKRSQEDDLGSEHTPSLAGEQKLRDTATVSQRGRNPNATGRLNGKQRGPRVGAVESDDVTDNGDGELDDVILKRAAIVKRAIDESVGDGDELPWVRPVFFGSAPSSSSLYRGQWTTGVKRAASTAFGGGSAGGGSRFPFYAGEGPKRSWRTNVIRVWGK